MLRYADNTRNRILDGLKKYSRIVGQARQRGMNERDTADIVKAMLGDMLGYDPFFDVTAEVSVRGQNADYAVLIERQLQFLLNVKSLAVVPNAAHLLRLSGSSTPHYAEWALLSNSDVWSCYRLGVGPDRHAELVFRVSLLDGASLEEKAQLFYLVCKEGVQAGALQDYWERVRILNPGRIAAMLLSDDVLNLIRRELQRTANYRIDSQSLYALLTREILRPDALAARNGQEGELLRQPHCFAYVRDTRDANTWRLLYRNLDTTPNAELLTQAVAELSGDARALGIPADDLPLVKERLRAAYFDLGVTPDELPDLLRR
ncbi:MAG: type restriction enzyme terminus family protein [Chthonomonadaceae bacterium]|nr:type restriction enzyme terminus family protein [Chthonomonadaceae bacterium]